MMVNAFLAAVLAGSTAGQLVADWNGHGMESSHVHGNWPDGTPCLSDEQYNALSPALQNPEISKRCAECASPEYAPWATKEGPGIVSCGHQRSADIFRWHEDGYECYKLKNGQTSIGVDDASDCNYCESRRWSYWPDFKVRCGYFKNHFCHDDSERCTLDLAKAQKKRKRWCGHCCTNASCTFLVYGRYCGTNKKVCSSLGR